jgi:hypothetical protein
MRAEAGFHPDDARRQRLECVDQRQPLYLAPEDDLASVVEADEVEDILANVDADNGYVFRRTLMCVGRWTAPACGAPQLTPQGGAAGPSY